MKSSHEILEWVVNVIRHIFRRSEMYAATAGDLQIHLWCYLSIWAQIVDRRDKFIAIEDEIYRELGSHPLGFAQHFIKSHPTASDIDAREFVLRQYENIANRLGVFETAGTAEDVE